MTGCSHVYRWRRFCGANVCILCNDHKGLARCYCGWPDEQGCDELEEMGEIIEDPDDYSL